MTERLRSRAALGLAALLLLTGCGAAPPDPVPTPSTTALADYDPDADGNGVALLAAAEARAVALAELRRIGAVSLRGTYLDAASGRMLSVSATGSRDRVRAEVAVDGGVTTFVVHGDDAWVSPSPGVAVATGLPAGEWACVPAADPLVQRWQPLLDPVALVTDLTADAAGLSAPAEQSVDVLLGAEGTAGVLTVATKGRPVPVRLVRADATGTLDVSFTGWGVEPDVTPPATC